MKYEGLTKEFKKAKYSALNRAGRAAVNEASKLIHSDYNLKMGVIKGSRRNEGKLIVSRLAFSGRAVVDVKVDPGNIELVHFAARQKGKSGRRKKGGARQKEGVVASVKRGQPKLYRSKDGSRGAFIAVMKSGHRGVFIRSESKAAINELFGISITGLFKRQDTKTMRVMIKTFSDRYAERLVHEINYRMGPS